MMTVNEKANKELDKARKALRNALDILSAEQAYNSKQDIFHNCTVKDVNSIITAIEILRD